MGERHTDCEHERVYSDFVMASYPAQYRWICRLCGLRGIERAALPQERETYDDLVRKFHGGSNEREIERGGIVVADTQRG